MCLSSNKALISLNPYLPDSLAGRVDVKCSSPSVVGKTLSG